MLTPEGLKGDVALKAAAVDAPILIPVQGGAPGEVAAAPANELIPGATSSALNPAPKSQPHAHAKPVKLPADQEEDSTLFDNNPPKNEKPKKKK